MRVGEITFRVSNNENNKYFPYKMTLSVSTKTKNATAFLERIIKDHLEECNINGVYEKKEINRHIEVV